MTRFSIQHHQVIESALNNFNADFFMKTKFFSEVALELPLILMSSGHLLILISYALTNLLTGLLEVKLPMCHLAI